ncbi:MAG TPA: PHB depolymerase family esterase [Acetobacteraceae bacterium]|nr:PHB depolymerase family esterase [Acetobacteraceae bacterium]
MTMKNILSSELLEATRLTNAGRLTEATAALQRMLSGQLAPASTNPQPRREPPTIDGVAEPAEAVGTKPAPQSGPAFGTGVGQRPLGSSGRPTSPPMPEALRSFLDQASHGGFQLPGGPAHRSPTATPVAVPEGARFLAASFSNPAGSRPYKLYVPSGYHGQPVPLIVMLHGCTQSPDDFAAGTRMNTAAEEHTCLVVYPGQIAAANPQKCWNWFSEADQQREGGEPSLIAGITRQVMRDYAVDPQRVYVAGLSAGGAAAAVMGETYPDLYAAIGVHSGLACGAARDVPSATAAMRQGSGSTMHRRGGASRSEARRRVVPAIVFHGDRDSTVNPRNGDEVVTQSARAATLRRHMQEGQIPGGHAYSRTLHVGADGRTVVEQWVVHGAGHAWFGGSPAGSYTDPCGPDATQEMLRFFLEHPLSTATQAG